MCPLTIHAEPSSDLVALHHKDIPPPLTWPSHLPLSVVSVAHLASTVAELRHCRRLSEASCEWITEDPFAYVDILANDMDRGIVFIEHTKKNGKVVREVSLLFDRTCS